MATENTEVEDGSTDTVDATETSGASMMIDADSLRSTLDITSALVDECKIHLEPDGLEIRAVDPANVGMVDVDLSASEFESYNANGGVIGVNLTRLVDIAGMADSDQIIEITLDEETRKLHIQIGGLEYTLALIDPDSIRDEPDLPDLDLSTEVVLEASDLDRGITAADMVSDHIELSADRAAEEVYMDAQGDTDDTSLTLTEDDLIDLVPGDASSLFSLDYLQDMVNAMPSNVAVTVELGDEFPVKLHFEYADGTGNATYMLAPRIQND